MDRILRRIFWSSFLFVSSAWSYDEPAVNLGYTSFYDGGPPAGPGLYYQNYFQHYIASKFADSQGNSLPLPRTDLDVNANIMQLIYLSHKRVLGASLGVSALVPWLLQARVNDGMYNAILSAKSGSGDLFIGPALQFDPIMREDGKGPRFVQRVECDIVVPIGRYNYVSAINPSSHFWSINPYWAATYWFNPQWSGSFRLHYLWNGVNHNPNYAFGPGVDSSQAGQAVFVDFALGFAFSEQFTVGANGYAFDQFTDTQVNGVDVPGRREQVWAIGPGLEYSFSKNFFMFMNLYSEQNAKNRPQGTNGMVRFAIHFT